MHFKLLLFTIMGLYYWFLCYMVPVKLFRTFFHFNGFFFLIMCAVFFFFIKDLEVVELSLPWPSFLYAMPAIANFLPILSFMYSVKWFLSDSSLYPMYNFSRLNGISYSPYIWSVLYTVPTLLIVNNENSLCVILVHNII